jgi:hypothetical protein
MPRPSFYNDNEYRAYPFVYAARAQTEPTAIERAVVDAGFILGLDADFNSATDSVWLHTVTRAANTITCNFKTDAVGAENILVSFSRNITAEAWTTEYAQSVPAANLCAREPVWEGFLVTSTLAPLAAQIASGQTLTFTKNEYQIEPARIQNLARSYLRSISVGNYARTQVPECGGPPNAARPIILNAGCLRGDIKLKEGYQCQITQNARTRTIDISASPTAGAEKDENFCANGGELPLFPGETTNGRKFFSNSPACDELIFSINGLGGKNITLLGGSGITVTAAGANALKLELNPNAQNACPPQNEPSP